MTVFVSIIIVNFNGKHLLAPCLDALRKQTYPSEHFEVIVSDNGSTDGSVELLRDRYAWVHVLENERNLGFALGNNVAIRAAKGDYVILLNNDVVPTKTWLENMVKAAEDFPSAGLVTGHLQLFYNQCIVEIESETIVLPDDGRALAIQVFGVNSNTPRGVVQYLDGFYGWEEHPAGRFRWSKDRALLGIPEQSGSGDWKIHFLLAAPRPDNQPVQVKISVAGTQLDEWELAGDAPEEYTLNVPAFYRSLSKPLVQNAGSIVFSDGSGRDRGTYIRNSEVFYETDEGQYSTEEVFAGCGASLLLRRQMLEDTGLFDADFFMYYEDTDLSWRARLRGWKVIYSPNAVARHIHCGTTVEWSPNFLYLIERNRLAMVFKNGAWQQVMRVWGGYSLNVARMGWQALIALLMTRPDWRQLASQMRIHLRVLTKLLLWQPSLWRKRIHIQGTAKVSPKKLSAWFVE